MGRIISTLPSWDWRGIGSGQRRPGCGYGAKGVVAELPVLPGQPDHFNDLNPGLPEGSKSA
jgi:hypothetical protein